jgi:hypothetical protein
MNSRFLCALAALALAGCSGLSDLTSDAFAPGPADEEKFEADSNDCVRIADGKRSWDLVGASADNMHKHQIFNRAYADCMTGRGYKWRTTAFDFWENYNL